MAITKGQLISNVKFQAADSPKKWTKGFACFDFKSCYVVKSNAVRWFFLEDLQLDIFAFEVNWPLALSYSAPHITSESQKPYQAH